MTVSRVATDWAAAVAELAAPFVHHLAVGAHDVGRDRTDVQCVFDASEQWPELVSVHAPRIEHEIRRAKAGAGVDQRRAADAPPDRQRDGGHADREREAVAAIEASQALWRRAREIAAIEMLALFEDDDLQARLGQLFRGDRPARAATDDDHVDRLIETTVRLLDRQLDDARVALHLLERLPVVADERLDAIVGAEEHQDQRLERDQRFAPLADLRGLAGHEVGLACRCAEYAKRPYMTAQDRR